jgi:sorting nexin-25
MLCDPSMLNERLLTYLTTKEANGKKRNKIYSYAANYEGFIGLIKTCTNIDDLKEMKYRVINEMMHTTRLMNIKPKNAADHVNSVDPSEKTTKADLLMSRDLNKYMNQLKYAKKLCDIRMRGFDTGFMDDVENVDEAMEREVSFFRS